MRSFLLAFLAVATPLACQGVRCGDTEDPKECCQALWTYVDLASSRFIFQDDACIGSSGPSWCNAHGVEDCRYCMETPACDELTSQGIECVPCPAGATSSHPIGCDCLGELSPEQVTALEQEGLVIQCDPGCGADSADDVYGGLNCDFDGVGAICRACVPDFCDGEDPACVSCFRQTAMLKAVPPSETVTTSSTDHLDLIEEFGCVVDSDCYASLKSDALDELTRKRKRLMCDASCNTDHAWMRGSHCDYFGLLHCRGCTIDCSAVPAEDQLDPSYVCTPCADHGVDVPKSSSILGEGRNRTPKPTPAKPSAPTPSVLPPMCQSDSECASAASAELLATIEAAGQKLICDPLCDVAPVNPNGCNYERLGEGCSLCDSDCSRADDLAGKCRYCFQAPVPAPTPAVTNVPKALDSCVTDQDCYDKLDPASRENLATWQKRLICDPGCTQSPATLNGYQCNFFGLYPNCRACWTLEACTLHGMTPQDLFVRENVIICPEDSIVP